ncbi:Crp/Fnr family transcriptional regulator [Chitinophaga filiformis]|uniref:cAMP-binding domain of CRP or a regulatory subunit of cAMP-dependent protein kinases n=1 Tax=Chitinophaga filiformis TaxID=104663 RepID=A0A1G7WPW9_CHIFI|nr:Crp/Fnr family transcriptional regulator [Chitinophaga filiformis]SDG73280.1 cAMP-binding domain of CRP or a regulatory subunit of cAMP-dependent protein kinases [Chitinophaga filiformis]
MELLRYINTKVKLSEEESAIIDAAFKRETYPKGTILMQPDNNSQKVFFVEKGLLRTFYNKDGKDITHFFFDENRFTLSLESVYFNRPDPYGREVLENATLRTILFRDFNALLNEIGEFKSLGISVAIEYLKLFSDKLYSLQFQTAEQRYKFMMDNYSNILSRAPLGHIASYLGITQQTLSVIRAKY